MLTRIDTK